jgi:hypothetical protein
MEEEEPTRRQRQLLKRVAKLSRTFYPPSSVIPATIINATPARHQPVTHYEASNPVCNQLSRGVRPGIESSGFPRSTLYLNLKADQG